GTQAGAGSMKSQFKRADSSGARYALVFGQQEVQQGTVIIKSLRDGAGAQELRSLTGVADWAATLQSPT
ncbi:MAG: histidine--tRNA ligase, partial [Rhodoferax sp.]|nr:histidine--tRNA ligase [Rhodoferax sp.]